LPRSESDVEPISSALRGLGRRTSVIFLNLKDGRILERFPKSASDAYPRRTKGNSIDAARDWWAPQ
jgi:hypothetical protein